MVLHAILLSMQKQHIYDKYRIYCSVLRICERSEYRGDSFLSRRPKQLDYIGKSSKVYFSNLVKKLLVKLLIAD